MLSTDVTGSTGDNAGDRQRFSLRPGPGENQAHLIQQAIDDCAAQGGGTVVLQPGIYRSGTVILRNGVTLHVERGATLLASDDLADYYQKDGDATALVFADRAEHIALTGEGAIDGNFSAFRIERVEGIDWVEASKELGTWIPSFGMRMRPRPLALVLLCGCRDVRMEHIRFQNSPRWTVHLLACTDVVALGVSIRNPIDVPNGDGFDLDGCSRVLLENCDIETSDDAIALKATRTFGYECVSREITVRRCHARTTCHGFCIGHETQDDFQDVLVSDYHISGWGGQRATTGIGIGMIDGASIRSVRICDVQMTHVVAPLHLRLSNEGRTFRGQRAYRRRPEDSNYVDLQHRQRAPGDLSDIILENVSVRDATGSSLVCGLPGHPLRRISLRRFKVELTKAAEPSRIMQEVPELEWEYPKAQMWRFLPAHGLFCRHVQDLELTGVTTDVPADEMRPAMLMEDVSPA